MHTARHIIQARRAIRQAFRYQVENRCYTFVEVLSTCPTNWGKTPNESVQWLDDVMVPYFKLGLKKSPDRPPVE